MYACFSCSGFHKLIQSSLGGDSVGVYYIFSMHSAYEGIGLSHSEFREFQDSIFFVNQYMRLELFKWQ